MFIPSFLRVLNLNLRPAFKQAQSVSRHTPRRHGFQLHAYSSHAATFRMHEDCLGELFKGQTWFLLVWCFLWSWYVRCYFANTPELNYEGKPVHLNYVWLRDHCRSASSFNAATNQRAVDTASVDLNIRPDDVTVQDGHLLLTCKSARSSV